MEIDSEFINKIKLLGLKNNNNFFTNKLNSGKKLSSDLNEILEYIGVNKKSKGFILMNEKTHDKILNTIDLKSINLVGYVVCGEQSEMLVDNEIIIGKGCFTNYKNVEIDFKNFYTFYQNCTRI